MKRLSALLLLMGAVVLAAGEPAQYTIKVGVDLVDVNFSVVDRKGRMRADLKESDFTIEEEGKKQEIAHFSRESELPLTLAMLLDISPSVRRVFPEEKHTAAAFLESILRPKDLALVISFDRHVTLVQDFSDNTDRLRSKIEKLTLCCNGTSLYDAVYLAASEKLAREVGRKAMILISDGQDTTSKVDLSKALIAADRSNAVIYSISNAAANAPIFGLPDIESGSPKTLRKLSDETGGAMFFVRESGDFQKVFDQIALELRSQYSIAYHSTNPERDGKFRRIKITPKDPSLTVRARKGYYAAAKAAIQ